MKIEPFFRIQIAYISFVTSNKLMFRAFKGSMVTAIEKPIKCTRFKSGKYVQFLFAKTQELELYISSLKVTNYEYNCTEVSNKIHSTFV